MSIHVSSANSSHATYQTVVRPSADASGSSDTSRYGTATDAAFVYAVDPLAAVQSLAEADAPLSDAELKQLFSAYKNLGRENEVWKDVGSLLAEFSGNDRANFLSVISRAGDNTKEFVSQLKSLDSDNRSRYLRTAVRLDPDEGLKDLIHSVKHTDKDLVSSFLDAADALGRSSKSLKANELRHFIAAAAGSPGAIEALIRKTSELGEDDRETFLKAAATSGKELGRLITTLDTLGEEEISPFLEAASKAGKGLSNLLDLTGSMDSGSREQMLGFIQTLTEKETAHFLMATQGLKATAAQLMETASGMSGTERNNFLTAAASAGENLDRFITMVNNLSPETGERSDFLSAAVKAEDQFTNFLSLTESLQGDDKAIVLSFASELGLVDLAGFLTASGTDAGQARELADAAEGLEGKNRSYFLYAAATSPDTISELSGLTRELEGGDLDNFLFTAANTEEKDDMAHLLSETSRLSGDERSQFLDRQQQSILSDGEDPLAKEYVFLKSAFSGPRFDALLNSGPDDIDRVISDVEAMDRYQRESFLDLAGAAGKEGMQTLLSLTAGLDEERTDDLMALSRSLNREDKKALIEAADLALNKSGGGPAVFDRLLSTARGLPEASRGHFLNAAAVSDNSLGKLMDLTRQIGGMDKTYFLIAAGLNADVDDDGGLVQAFVAATDYLYNDILGNVLELGDRPEGIRPSELISSRTGAFNDNPKPNTVRMSLYMESAAFMAAQKDAPYEMRLNWYNSFRRIPPQDL